MDHLPGSLIKLSLTDISSQRSLPRNGWISFWEAGDAIPMPRGLCAAALFDEKLSALEIKGNCPMGLSFDLSASRHPLWLVFSFIGPFSANRITAVDAGHYTACSFGDEQVSCRLGPSGKTSLLILGIPDDGRHVALLQEWPQVAESCPQPIGYRQQQVLKKLQQVQRKPYSTAVKLHDVLVQLLDLFHADLLEARKSQDMEQVALYHRAIAYIRKHYLDTDIDRSRIAEALNVSIRTLNRAFEGKTNNVISTIRMVRLYKARDLIRGTDMPLEEIAFKLHYTDAKHLSKKYLALFNCSPAQERKTLLDRKNRFNR